MRACRYDNVYIEPLSKKKCDCEEPYQKAKGNIVYTCFNYYNAKRRTMFHFCINCWDKKKQKLEQHTRPVNIVSKCYPTLPHWVTLENKPEVNAASGKIIG